MESLNLRKYYYYFECAMLFLNVMLRSSILYAGETYYNLKEVALRQTERIEEDFLRKLFKTSRGCSISKLYLESGNSPSRFEISKMRLLEMHFAWETWQDDSQILETTIWKSIKRRTCLQDLNDLKLNLSLEDIKLITKKGS